VSRLFRERVVVTLAPTQLLVGEKAIPCDPAFGAEPWQGALQALRTIKLPKAKITVVLSNHFVRYALVPWSDALAGAAEEEAYVRHHFVRIHGERAKSWALRCSEAPRGAPRLASAVDRELVEALKGACPGLASVQPWLMAAINRWRREIPPGGAWLLLAEREPERACIALHARGAWRSVQNAKGAWLDLLERERHRAGGEVPDLVLLAGARPGGGAPGWTFRALQPGASPMN